MWKAKQIEKKHPFFKEVTVLLLSKVLDYFQIFVAFSECLKSCVILSDYCGNMLTVKFLREGYKLDKYLAKKNNIIKGKCIDFKTIKYGEYWPSN